MDVAQTDLHHIFSREPLAAFLDELARAGRPLTFEELKTRLVAAGVPEHEVGAQWSRHERAVKDHARIYYMPETRTYAWGPEVMLPDAAQAVQLLASGKAQIKPDRRTLGEIVLAALNRIPQQRTQPPRPGPGREEARRQKIFEERLKADSARAYAKVAMELEELIASGASARALLQRIHAGAHAHGLRPIGSAGATIKFDRLRHDPVVASTRDGSDVLVVRPGYVWDAGSEEVLVAKAVVIEQ
jgi:hypothetical protein